MMNLSELGELNYAPIRPRACDLRDQYVLTDAYGPTKLPFAPLPHNEGLTKSQRKNLKRRVAKKELKSEIAGKEKVVHRPP